MIRVNYQELNKKRLERYNDFFKENGFFAFGKDQFEDGKIKINTPNNEDIINIGMGGYIKRSSAEEYRTLLIQSRKEESEWLNNRDNLKQALLYELANHEYHINEEIEDTLDALLLPEGYWKNQENIDFLESVIKEYMKRNNY